MKILFKHVLNMPGIMMTKIFNFLLSFVPWYYRCGSEGGFPRHIPGVVYVQGLMVVCSVFLVHSTSYSLSQKEGLPVINQLAAWSLLGWYGSHF